MKHTYTILGMSCDGCRSKVEKTLNAIDRTRASITLDPPMATIIMDKHIPTTQLQQALTVAGNYTITMNNGTRFIEATDDSSEKSCCSSVKKVMVFLKM